MRDVIATAVADKLLLAGNRTVLESGTGRHSGGWLLARAATLAAELRRRQLSRVALFADNGATWIIADLACQLAEVIILPLPQFFSESQLRHCLNLIGPDVLLCDNPVDCDKALHQALNEWQLIGDTGVWLLTLQPAVQAPLPANTAKITFTSGTTGQPKGVCLSGEQQLTVVNSLLRATQLEAPRHLCLLPLTTLLENLAGVYAPLLAGGLVAAPALSELGITGSSGLDVQRLLRILETQQPHTVILIPQLLMALTAACEKGWRAPSSLRFMAVGGAPVSQHLLDKARRAGLPAYEGYGLSECASVVALNTPGADCPGSAGRVLEHLQVSIDDGEIVIQGNSFLGYAGQPDTWGHHQVRSGDLGYVDEQGFLHVVGRHKNVIISSFGRNINPEWIEAELLSSTLLAQCVVVGEGKPCLSALLYPRDPNVTDNLIQNWIDRINITLPDYARIHYWYRLPQPLSNTSGLLTDNNRPRRDAIQHYYCHEIQILYHNAEPIAAINSGAGLTLPTATNFNS